MPRIARVIAPGFPHHIIQRGNNRQDVFFTDDDRRFYLQTLLKQARTYGLTVNGYCLMTNHVHLIATPRKPESLAKAIGRTHLVYAQYVNRLHGRSGHFWQNRFFSCPMDEAHLMAAMRYVERNPVRAKLCRAPWRYGWSSAAAHCGEREDATGLLDLAWWKAFATPGRWKASLRRADEEAEIKKVRQRTRLGRPLGGDRFIAKLESKLNRRLRVPPRGRPRRPSKRKRKES